MDKESKKPHYIEVKRENASEITNKKQEIRKIKTLLEKEKFAVLATNAKHESYTSLISFVTDKNAAFIAFSTPIETRKYQMIEKDENVSLLIDNRSDNQEDINDIIAITALGKAKILQRKEEKEEWSKLLVDKQAYLDDFIYADTSAMILVKIDKYRYVSSFQEVIEWTPNTN